MPYFLSFQSWLMGPRFWNKSNYARRLKIIESRLQDFHSSLISLNRNPVFKKSLRLLVTCASSFQSFTVNSISLSSLGCSQEIFAGTLWLHLWHTGDQPSKSPWLSWSQNHTEVRTSDDLLDGSLRGWEECKGCSIWGKEVWLTAVQVAPQKSHIWQTFD